ncbi:MAG: SLATT domain-containing protein [Candidatus Neptunochlamydia sp.]|nr:SLATT domain-containing protein [Candidatus Neptunochlamydia sp.]
MSEALIKEIAHEVERIEEDALHSGKSHFNASSLWSTVHYILGIPMTVCAAWAGINAFSDASQCAGYLGMTTAALAALQTFINASSHASQHKRSGGEYFALKNQVRLFRRIELENLQPAEAIEKIKGYSQKRDELNGVEPCIPYPAFWLARFSINKGNGEYRIDKEQQK